MRVKQTKVYRLANVAVGFHPCFTDFVNFERGKLKPAAMHDVGCALEQPAARFNRGPAPFFVRFARRFYRTLGFRNSRFGDVADYFVR